MASLTGNAIKDSYLGLLKTTDNATITATGTKSITDGEGNASPLKLSQQEVHVIATEFNGGVCVQSNEIYLLDTAGSNGVLINNTGSIFGGAVDFSAATVTGLPAGAAGLESGTGANSLKNADSLVTTPATANGGASIALGNGATADSSDAIAIGPAANGDGAQAVAIGRAVVGSQDSAVAIGNLAQVWAIRSVAVGRLSKACATCSVAIGTGAQVTSSGTGAVALGAGVTAAKACTVTVRELETCVAGGGIYLTTPDGTAQPKLTVDNSCALLIGGNPVGGGGAAGLESGTGTDSLKNADSLVTNPATASSVCSIALGNGACATGDCSVAYGRGAISTGLRSVALGSGACATGDISISIGENAQAIATGSISIGRAIQKNTTSVQNITIAAPQSAFDWGARQRGVRAIQIGSNGSTDVTANLSVAVGHLSWNTQAGAVAIGANSRGLADCAISIGYQACATATCAVALGQGVTAAKANTVSVVELETQLAGGGITMKSPNGTEYKLTVDDAGSLVIT